MLSTLDYTGANQLDHRPTGPKVVAIASSGGGLSALCDFFRAVPENPGVSFVVAQHLPADHRALLEETLARIARPEVRFVEDDADLETDVVYVVPSTHDAVIREGSLRLLPVRSRWERHPELDDLFTSMAENAPHSSIGVLLSGRGSDGAKGLAKLEAAGATVVVQDPRTANRGELPRAGIEATRDPWILPPELMYSVVEALEQNPDETPNPFETLDDIDPWVEPVRPSYPSR